MSALLTGILAVIAVFAAAMITYWMFVAPIVSMPGRSFRGNLPQLSDSEQQLAGRLRGHVEKLAGEIGARSLTASPDGLERSAAYIEQMFTSLGYKPLSQRFTVDDRRSLVFLEKHLPDYPANTIMGRQARNVIAELEGETRKVVVIGGHYDTVFGCPGANDNASGVAALLEIARALSGEKLPCTVRFVAFANEEPPFFRTSNMGSAHYARLCHDRGDEVVAMLSLETIGSYSDKPGSQKYPKPFNLFYPNTGNFISFVANTRSRELVRRCVELFRLGTRFPSEGVAAPEKVRGIDFSDHLWFWHFGYPAVMVTDTAFCRYDHYHEESDTPDKLDYDRFARVVAGLSRVILELAKIPSTGLKPGEATWETATEAVGRA